MTDDELAARVAAGDLPPLPDAATGEGEALGRMAERLAATATLVLGGRDSAPRVTANATVPEAQSFRRSEAYLAGQIARAAARGQRVL